MVGVGLFYRRGYFRQRLDLPAAAGVLARRTTRRACRWRASTAATARRCGSTVTLFGAPSPSRSGASTSAACRCSCSTPSCRRTTRCSAGRRRASTTATAHVRLAQYGLLGIGGARVLEALGIEPAVVHLNEGHPALAALELAAERVAAGVPLEDALASVREHVVFTTHTPVPAGNETIRPSEFLERVRRARRAARPRRRRVPRPLPRRSPARASPGMTPLAMRVEPPRTASAGCTARSRARCGGRCSGAEAATCRSTHVTNGAHLADVPRRADARAARRASRRAAGCEPRGRPRAVGRRCATIPNEELWAARCDGAAAAGRVHPRRRPSRTGCCAASRSTTSARSPTALDADALTLGFARRLATYKRLYLLDARPRPRAPHPRRRRSRCSS